MMHLNADVMKNTSGGDVLRSLWSKRRAVNTT